MRIAIDVEKSLLNSFKVFFQISCQGSQGKPVNNWRPLLWLQSFLIPNARRSHSVCLNAIIYAYLERSSYSAMTSARSRQHHVRLLPDNAIAGAARPHCLDQLASSLRDRDWTSPSDPGADISARGRRLLGQEPLRYLKHLQWGFRYRWKYSGGSCDRCRRAYDVWSLWGHAIWI